MEVKNTVAINTSTSKQNYSFSKSKRFTSPKTPTAVLFYEKKNLFTKEDSTCNQGRAFQKSNRFSYYHSPEKEAKVFPSPNKYDIKGHFGGEHQKNN